jgi:chaperonin cofactor prefoldin
MNKKETTNIKLEKVISTLYKVVDKLEKRIATLEKGEPC